MMRTIAVVVALALMASSVARADDAVNRDPSSAAGAAKDGRSVSAGLRGSIQREAARLARASGSWTTVQPDEGAERSWPARHPVVLGEIVGVAGGIFWGAWVCRHSGCEGDARPFMALGAAVGAGIGAGIGGVVSLVTP